MATSNKTIDFDLLTAKINSNYARHVQNVKKLNIKSYVLPFSQCNELLQEQMKSVSVSSAATSRDTVSDYAKLFKQLEEYPVNVHKPKEREIHRANNTVMTGSTSSLMESVAVNINNSSGSLNFSKSEEQQMQQLNTSEIYNDFKKFQQKLRRARTSMLTVLKVEMEYANKLRQLENLTQQLEKLLLADQARPGAFSPEEQAKLTTIATNLAELNYIKQHGNLFPQQENEISKSAQLQTLMEVLNYTLVQLGDYNV